MSEPFLILHKVRGQSAFDIAEKMDCPLCIPSQNLRTIDECNECNGGGYWWIIPTSGHRAYPYWHEPMYSFINVNSEVNQSLLNRAWSGEPNPGPVVSLNKECPPMPDDLPDHCHYELDRDKSPIASTDVQLALAKLIKQTPMVRRRL